ncbi:MAG: exodeoxyribonuclease VII small subunit [Candidatus Omnitrophica bacterium]|nr:exodeoxyribonuclease VII small subunit [Candidatus Omnitrophota bacterium]MBU0895552.1 exodeoxyribonuclease VII small subunit [Candidatus Omnitrophota bacterium]MBU1038102.1 exodeoxyribonuclease VII small subunit [Candidatus Omnitrophota bacterium]MBU1808218.1 exodeoxyribonuclease VII small subunit [Candidatus Omnitrophota bacterium]
MASEMKFEESLKRLEKIVQELENGDLPLDEACEKYEEGIRLSKACAKKLEQAKKRVEILLKNEDGSIELKEFDQRKAQDAEKPQDPKKKKAKTDSEGELI